MKTRSGDVYTLIRRRVVDGKLRGGTRISEAALSKELGLSRGPVREAVMRLTGEGLLEYVPSAGTFVKDLNRSELIEIYQLRQWIEGGSAAHAAQNADSQQLMEIDRCCEDIRRIANHHRNSGAAYVNAEDFSQVAVADLSFHLALIRASGNLRAVKLLGDQHVLSCTLSTASEPWDLPMIDLMYEEHTAISNAVRSKDSDVACQLMQQHVAGALGHALKGFDLHRAGLTTTETLGVEPGELQHELQIVEKHNSDQPNPADESEDR